MLVFFSEEPIVLVWDQSHAPRTILDHQEWPKGLFFAQKLQKYTILIFLLWDHCLEQFGYKHVCLA